MKKNNRVNWPLLWESRCSCGIATFGKLIRVLHEVNKIATNVKTYTLFIGRDLLRVIVLNNNSKESVFK